MPSHNEERNTGTVFVKKECVPHSPFPHRNRKIFVAVVIAHVQRSAIPDREKISQNVTKTVCERIASPAPATATATTDSDFEELDSVAVESIAAAVGVFDFVDAFGAFFLAAAI
jgi:hypothetical protein